MENTIVPLYKILGKTAKLHRVLWEAGLSEEALQWPIDNSEFRRKLVAYWLSLENQKECLKDIELRNFRTIRLGTGLQSQDDFQRALLFKNCRITSWTKDIMGKAEFTVASGETEIDLVAASVAELGFMDGAQCQEIYERAREFGLEPCPPEVGPQLRLQYKDQPEGEWLLIAMEPIIGTDGRLLVFSVGHDEYGPCLTSGDGRPEAYWREFNRWVFLRRK